MTRIRKKPTTTYKKVVVKKSGKTKVKSISEAKFKKKLAQAAKRKRKIVTKSGIRRNGVPLQTTISKKNDKGRKKTFVQTTTTPTSRKKRKVRVQKARPKTYKRRR